jgi:hypothetical protein
VVVKVVPPGVPFSTEFVLALSSGPEGVVEDQGGTDAASGTEREINCSLTVAVEEGIISLSLSSLSSF